MLRLIIRQLMAAAAEEPQDDEAAELFAAAVAVDDEQQHLLNTNSWGAQERYILFNLVCVVLNLAFVALLAGLYLGLLTLDVMDLQILERVSKDDDERKYATEVLPIVKERHLLLVTILLVDSLAYESLPIFLEALVPGWIAILLSSTLILVFGEIVPSGIFTGPNQLFLAYTMAPVVRFCMWLFYPLASPIAQLLDYLTRDGNGDDHGGGEAYDREELSALVRIQHEERMKKEAIYRRPSIKEVIKYNRNKDRQWNALKSEIMERVNEMHNEADNNSDEETETASRHYSTSGGGDRDRDRGGGGAAMDQLVPPLHPTEVCMIEGALSLGTKWAMDVYTPFTHTYALPHDLILDKATVTDIFYKGYSRVPIYRRNPHNPDDQSAYLGFLITRHLMMIDWQDKREISTLYLKRPVCVSPKTNLVDALKVLQHQGPQMSFVCARPDLANKALEAEEPIPIEAGLMGIVTLVDIMESILQDRIYDEEDIRDRDRAVTTLTRWAATKLQSFLLKKTNPNKVVSIVVPAPPQPPIKPSLPTRRQVSADRSSPSSAALASNQPTTSTSPSNGGVPTSTQSASSSPAAASYNQYHHHHHHNKDKNHHATSASAAAVAAEMIAGSAASTNHTARAPASETTPLLWSSSTLSNNSRIGPNEIGNNNNSDDDAATHYNGGESTFASIV
ncbi:hypothetical protein ACA910_007116 [Epithemia clementina (nom. ined.)]